MEEHKYRSLSILATTLKVFGWIALGLGGALTIFFFIQAFSQGPWGFIRALIALSMTLLYAVVFLAMGDFYRLMIDLKEDVERIRNNTHKLEKEESH